MIEISKSEAKQLRKLGYDEFVKCSHSKHKKYYLVEERDDVYKYNRHTKEKELVRLSTLNALFWIRDFDRTMKVTNNEKVVY
jgi:hypothetical protein